MAQGYTYGKGGERLQSVGASEGRRRARFAPSVRDRDDDWVGPDRPRPRYCPPLHLTPLEPSFIDFHGILQCGPQHVIRPSMYWCSPYLQLSNACWTLVS